MGPSGGGPETRERHGSEEITLVYRAWRNRTAKSQNRARVRFAIDDARRDSRPRRGPHTGDITMSAGWLLGTVYTWPCGSSSSDRRRLPAGGDRGRCRLRRTERYAQFDRRCNTIENISSRSPTTALSLSLDRPHPRPDSPPRAPFLPLYGFFLSLLHSQSERSQRRSHITPFQGSRRHVDSARV